MRKRNAIIDNDIQSESPQKKFKHDPTEQLMNNDPHHDFVLTKEIVDGVVLTDLCQKNWKVGKPIGKGSFGEIFLASDDIKRCVTSDNAKYVVKIEPHSNGPLFVEIHCLINIGKCGENERVLPLGMPEYIASGSHYFRNVKYRFLILPRFTCDLHSIIKNKRIDQRNLFIIACQVLDVLEHIHDKGYAHSDIKAENMMIGTCRTIETDFKSVENINIQYSNVVRPRRQLSMANERQYLNGNSHFSNDNGINDGGNDSDDDSSYCRFVPPSVTKQRQKNRNFIEYSGSNPVRSCRMERKTSTYQDMLSSHYLRPIKKINYFISEDEVDDFHGRRDRSNNMTLASITTVPVTRRQHVSTGNFEEQPHQQQHNQIKEDRIFLIDFGLASKFIDSTGNHRPFCMDQRRAHDGTLEFTSRDAHMGAHSRRSDLECLGYNIMFWHEGSLPWKDTKLMTQPEQVHRMKEYFMTDVKKVFRDVYGHVAPKFLTDFLQYVGGLAYHDRPDYNYCRSIFTSELKTITPTNTTEMSLHLDLNILRKQATMKKSQKESENNNVRLKDVQEMMRLGLMMDNCQKNCGSPRISPKNLRSKSDKIPKRQRKKFSWTDILSTDPDQIARQRAEKEYERDAVETPLMSRYKGKPTYAILAVENRMRLKDKLDSRDEWEHIDEATIKGYTKPMMDVLRKKQLNSSNCNSNLFIVNNSMVSLSEKKKKSTLAGSAIAVASGTDMVSIIPAYTTTNVLSTTRCKGIRQRRRKSGLRNYVKPTEKNILYRQAMINKKRRNGNSEFTPTDESSCGSVVDNSGEENTNTSASTTTKSSLEEYNSSSNNSSSSSSQSSYNSRKRGKSTSSESSSPTTIELSDEDYRDTSDYYSSVPASRFQYRKRSSLRRNQAREHQFGSRKFQAPNGGRVSKKTIKDDTLKRLRAFIRG